LILLLETIGSKLGGSALQLLALGRLAILAFGFASMVMWGGLIGCTTAQTQALPPELDRGQSWALLPILNLTETPQAGLRAESILESLIRAGGVRNLKRYPSNLNTESIFDPVERKAQEQAVIWAKGEKVRFALSGSVEEWRYKVGVDGEPAVGITLQIIDLSNDAVIWTAAGSKSGWSREALSAVAQKLIAQLIAPLVVAPGSAPVTLPSTSPNGLSPQITAPSPR
jgi:polysaccharide biosynthesis protein PelC